MDLAQLQAFFDASPIARLLRDQHAPIIAAFLHGQFKDGKAIAITESQLLGALEAFQDDVRERFPDVLRQPAASYLSEWSERTWLKRTWQEGIGEPVYELTPATEQVLEFLTRVHAREPGFVATGSRLRLAIASLESLVAGTADDPDARLAHLRAERDRLDREIARIKHDGARATEHPARIREQFATAVGLLRELQSDFRAVEERFRNITRDVQQRQLHGLDSRGGILADILDAEDALRNDDQGVSFFEFFRLIQSPEQQERLRTIVEQTVQLPELAGQTEGLKTLREMKSVLLAEAARVTRTERRLSTTIRRLLDGRTQRERQQVATLLREIRGLAAAMSNRPPVKSVALEVEASVKIASPFAKTFWAEPPEFEHIDLTDQTQDEAGRLTAFSQFAQLQHLDVRSMKSTIRSATAQYGSLTLRELLEQHPPESGVLDVVGYLQIACDDGHLVSDEAREEIVLSFGNGRTSRRVTVPLVTFLARNGRDE
jgi:chorismate mutase